MNLILKFDIELDMEKPLIEDYKEIKNEEIRFKKEKLKIISSIFQLIQICSSTISLAFYFFRRVFLYSDPNIFDNKSYFNNFSMRWNFWK